MRSLCWLVFEELDTIPPKLGVFYGQVAWLIAGGSVSDNTSRSLTATTDANHRHDTGSGEILGCRRLTSPPRLPLVAIAIISPDDSPFWYGRKMVAPSPLACSVPTWIASVFASEQRGGTHTSAQTATACAMHSIMWRVSERCGRKTGIVESSGDPAHRLRSFFTKPTFCPPCLLIQPERYTLL